MISINEEQLQQYQQNDPNNFLDFICQNLTENIPELVDDIPKEVFDEMVQNGIDKAKYYDLQTDEDIAAFVTIMFEISPNFDSQKDINDVLMDTSIAPKDKMDQIFEQVSSQAWSEAELMYDSDSWFPQKPSATPGA